MNSAENGRVTEFAQRMAQAEQRMVAKVAEAGGDDAYFKQVEADKQRMLAEAVRQEQAAYAKRLLEQSGLGRRFFGRTFGNFEINDANKRAFYVCRQIATQFDGRKGAVLAGDNGIGKTHLAAAIVNELAAQGRIVYFGNIVDIKARVYGGFGDNSVEAVVRKMLECDLLCIDDLGKEKMGRNPEGDYMRELVYKLINRLYEDDRGVVITTNLDAAECEERYGTATVSRLCEMCEYVYFADEDHRLG